MLAPISSNELWHKMNCAGTQSQPFIFAIDYDMENAYFCLDPFIDCGLYWEIDGNGNSSMIDRNNILFHDNVEFKTYPTSFVEYEQAFKTIQTHIKDGNTFLANLTMPTCVETNCSLEEIFIRSRSRFKFLIPNKLVCFSPEIFVNISDRGRISSFPMKGTISGSIPNAEQVILNDYKETAEHHTIVDFIRSDISRVAVSVNVDKLRYIDILNTSHGEILQVSSEISGVLPHQWENNLGTIIRELLPAGSISGAPKIATLKAIQEAEICKRGFYTGVFGYFDGKNLKSVVMIRYIEQNTEGTLTFHSGGGITINSQCEEEYKEMCNKVYLPW